jgi:hypothetical protein
VKRAAFSTILVRLTRAAFIPACREVVTDLIEEYKAAERADYVTYGSASAAATSAGTDPRDPTMG